MGSTSVGPDRGHDQASGAVSHFLPTKSSRQSSVGVTKHGVGVELVQVGAINLIASGAKRLSETGGVHEAGMNAKAIIDLRVQPDSSLVQGKSVVQSRQAGATHVVFAVLANAVAAANLYPRFVAAAEK